jgi:hypothetical protein
MSDVSEFLGGNAAPSISWKNVPNGTTITGKIVSSAVVNQTDPKDGKVKYWDDGNPMKQLVITLHNPEWIGEVNEKGDVNKTGEKRLFASGAKKPKRPEERSMVAAIIEALKKADATLEPGGELTVQFIGEGDKTNPAFNPPKFYRAKYVKPVFDPADSWDEEPFG